MDFNKIDREYQQHKQNQQPPLPAGSREWQDCDIDWSHYEAWMDSVLAVRATGSPAAKAAFDSALATLGEAVQAILRLDPRCARELRWGDRVFFRGKEYMVGKPIGIDEVELHNDAGVITVPCSAIGPRTD